MKAILILCCATLATAYAQESPNLDEILRKRDAVLTEILETEKKQEASGQGAADATRTAAINLYAFRRDSAKAKADRIAWQKKIVAIEKERKDFFTKCVAMGVVTSLDETLAEERMLAALQKLAELQLAK